MHIKNMYGLPQNPVKKLWPRCPACKTAVDLGVQPDISQPPTVPRHVESLEESSMPRTQTLIGVPSLQSHMHFTFEEERGSAPTSERGLVTVQPQLQLPVTVLSALEQANEIAKQAGFDRICAACKAPVRVLLSFTC